MKHIAFIGLGVMGLPMARNLMRAGFELSIFTRTKSKAGELIGAGAKWRETPAECIRGCEAAITMVGVPKDVEEVYFGENGIFAAAEAGQYLIDMTTTSPTLSVKIYERAKQMGAYALDAPVSGGDIGAENASLSIMVGGDAAAFEHSRELLGAMGTTLTYEGPAGSGQHTKAANQIAVAGALAGVAEALAYAEANGLEPEKLFSSISKGAAASFQLTNLGPKMAAGDYRPGFFMKHFVKDMKIVRGEAEKRGLSLPVVSGVLSRCEVLEKAGYADSGTQAIIESYR